MRMQSAYSVTNIHGNKEIVETDQTIEFLTQEDIVLITTTYLNRNNHGIADLSRKLSETEVHDSIRDNMNHQAFMLKVIADEIDKERNIYTPTDEYETWSSNPKAVAEFVNTLCEHHCPEDTIDLSASTWTEVSTKIFSMCSAQQTAFLTCVCFRIQMMSNRKTMVPRDC